MEWKLISKSQKNQPSMGTYSDWKEQIAEECYYRCVYCSIHEAQFGGIDHYHIDHFKPKSKFPKLKEDILNLFYACPICNRFKSDDWPGEPNLHSTSYIDPSKINYSELFDLKDNCNIEGKYVAANYIIIRLFLNRAQLIFERREYQKRMHLQELQESINELLKQVDKFDITYLQQLITTTFAVYYNIISLENKRREIRPYKLSEIRKS